MMSFEEFTGRNKIINDYKQRTVRKDRPNKIFTSPEKIIFSVYVKKELPLKIHCQNQKIQAAQNPADNTDFSGSFAVLENCVIHKYGAVVICYPKKKKIQAGKYKTQNKIFLAGDSFKHVK